jgi:hypothetical protein
MATEVNWSRLGLAINWYKSLGYEYMDVTWIVPDEVYEATKPTDIEVFSCDTLGGNLVASGEQSFMQAMDWGRKIGKAVCCTPCFRAENTYDDFHLPYFMKVELIHKSGGKDGLALMIKDAFNFFENACSMRCKVVEMPDGSYDIVDAQNGIELGSYGIRRWKDFSWVYGTGVAEPRTSQVLDMTNRSL